MHDYWSLTSAALHVIAPLISLAILACVPGVEIRSNRWHSTADPPLRFFHRLL